MIATSNRLTNFKYAIRNIVGAAEELELSGRPVTYLNIGDPQIFGFRPPPHVIEAVQRALSDSFTGYAHSTGLFEARASIAAYATGLSVPTTPDDVIVTSGTSEGAELVLTAVLNEGDELLLPTPGYPIYPAIAAKLGAQVNSYRLAENENWQPSIAEIASLITARTKAIVLINPNNPTGAVTRDETTVGIIELAAEHDLLVISDEVYRELCFIEPPTSASVLAENAEAAVITLESLSKTHSIPGWRVGWMRFTHAEKMRELIASINRLASGRLCSPTPAQYAIKPALEGDRTCVDQFRSQIKARRDSAVLQIRSIDGLSCTTPEAAFYLMMKVEDLDGRTDEEFVLEMLRATGVLTVHGSGFGCDARDGYFRLVYLADQPVLTRALTKMHEFVEQKNNYVRESK